MRAREPHGGRRGEAGASVVETVLIAPALLVLLMLIVQFGLVAFAQSVARSAAEDGAAKARQFNGTTAAARATAYRELHDLGGGVVGHQSVSVTRSPTKATVTVTGTVLTLVPGFSFHLHEMSAGPVERFVPPAGDSLR
jgi:Flp pilus assembly protein TadG